MNKELDCFDIAGILQAKSYQFHALGLNTAYKYNTEEQALKSIEALINDLEGYRELLKERLTEQEKQAKERRLKEQYEYGSY